MKKVTVLFCALAVLAAVSSCRNQNRKTEDEAVAGTDTVTANQEYFYEDFKLNVQNLVASTKELKSAPFISTKDGNVMLSDKEKLARPQYLLDPSVIDNLVTLSQKYRAVAMLSIDRYVAKLYDMPVSEYDAALQKIVVDINDESLKNFADKVNAGEDLGIAIGDFFEEEIDAGRANLFWEALAAASVEQVYVCTRNINKFMPMFDDQSASDVTYNFILVHDGFRTMLQYYPEMESLNEVLTPLYVINAISVDQLREQLTELKGEIEVVREFLLK